jgi:hypothetical protein
MRSENQLSALYPDFHVSMSLKRRSKKVFHMDRVDLRRDLAYLIFR